MVFIVKIPSRSRANTPEASNTPSNESVPPLPTMSQQPFQTDVAQTPPLPAPTASAGMDITGAASSSSRPNTTTEASTPPTQTQTQLGAELDILLAPSVLNHRYVRGVDKSLIVERPERIRAVLLGIATAIGKTSSDRPQQPPLPTHPLQHSPTKGPVQQQNVFDLSTPSQSSATTHAATAQPASTNTSSTDEDDDLVARLSSLSVQSQSNQAQQPAVAAQLQKFRVLHSTRSLPLDPPHPAVAFAHAHSDELVAVLESAYDQAKQKRRDARAASSVPPSAALASSLDPAHAKSERETTPTPASIVADPTLQQQAQSGPSTTSPVRTSHAAYLEHLCGRAPNHPPLSHRKPTQTSPAKSIPEDSEAYTSSDGEGDDAMHLSEVPEHLPQGDLYLAGPDDHNGQDGGSGEAIRHAMGACCEAVDRVVSAAAASAGTMSSKPSVLSEIRVEDSAQSTDHAAAPAPAAKRAFVLSRPPGHHCSGSTPQGFCWVNNAIVASAHAYLSHSIDRIVIFDIDLHHGNGTQNLAWRINADANKHDDHRAERISSLRAAALERARHALVSAGGSGRAHASRIAKVALTEQDEAEVRRQAGKRALRLFYSSLHDIESFPCEDGDANMIKDASTCVEGAHGQWIWNVHLDHYRSESDFRRLYDEKYAILFHKAARFLSSTSATPESTLVLISAGFDACAYEYPGMQRHGKHVPPSFYHTFARDAVRFADTHADGKLVSVLEGGYSDRALCSAALAHVTGLATSDGAASASTTAAVGGEGEAEYWKLENLIAVEKVAKKMAAHAAAAEAGGVGSTNTTPKRRQAELTPWLATTSKVFAAFEQACGKSNVVALGATATPLRGAAAAATARAGGAASAINSPANLAAGRVLRDRAPLKTRPGVFDSATSTPQARRAASPTKTPTRTAAKKDSPSKARAAGNPFVTPAKSESRPEDGDVSMAMEDGETPTRGAGKGLAATPLKAEQQASGVGVAGEEVSTPPLPEPRQTDSKNTIVDASSIVIPDVPSLALEPVSTTTTSLPSIPTSATFPISPTTTSTTSPFIPTSSPAFTPVPVTLVDAMSPPDRRIVDVNTDAIVTSDVDPLGLKFLRKQSFQFANGSPAVTKREFVEGEEDAPGSPDLSLVGGGVGEKERYEGYFPVMPGGLDGAEKDERSGDQQQAVAQKQGSSTNVASSLYPNLPSSLFPHTQPSQQQ